MKGPSSAEASDDPLRDIRAVTSPARWTMQLECSKIPPRSEKITDPVWHHWWLIKECLYIYIHLFHTLIAQVTALPVGNQRLKKLSFKVSDRWAIQLPYICSCSIVPRSSSGGRRLTGLWCAIASALRPSKALAPPVLHWWKSCLHTVWKLALPHL